MNKIEDRRTTILLVEEDDDTRPLLKQGLQRDGCHVIVALDEEDALERVTGGRTAYDLLVLDVVGVETEEALDSAARIHRRAEMDAKTPVVVMAEKYGEEMEGGDVAVGENVYVTYLENAEQLQRLLARLLPHAPTSF
jgi:CheY-like chemotaxis protein